MDFLYDVWSPVYSASAVTLVTGEYCPSKKNVWSWLVHWCSMATSQKLKNLYLSNGSIIPLETLESTLPTSYLYCLQPSFKMVEPFTLSSHPLLLLLKKLEMLYLSNKSAIPLTNLESTLPTLHVYFVLSRRQRGLRPERVYKTKGKTK